MNRRTIILAFFVISFFFLEVIFFYWLIEKKELRSVGKHLKFPEIKKLSHSTLELQDECQVLKKLASSKPKKSEDTSNNKNRKHNRQILSNSNAAKQSQKEIIGAIILDGKKYCILKENNKLVLVTEDNCREKRNAE